MSRYNTQVLSNIRMLCRMQNIDEKVLYERAKLILSIYREVCWSTIDRANDVCDTLICTFGHSRCCVPYSKPPAFLIPCT